jgi:hypothetical protein
MHISTGPERLRGIAFAFSIVAFAGASAAFLLGGRTNLHWFGLGGTFGNLLLNLAWRRRHHLG